MAKRDEDLFKSLRARGVRKKIAGELSRATSAGASPKVARKAVADLASVVGEVQDRLRGGPEKRSAAARKAAKTRKLKAKQRSDAAKKAARTRSRS